MPADKFWGAQTERSRNNFKIGPAGSMPMEIVRAFAHLKRAAAWTNRELGVLEASKTSLQRDLREVKGRLQACVKASSEAAGVLLLVERSLLTGDDGREEVVSQIEKAARVLLEATERSERRLAEAMEALYHALVSGRRRTSHAAERLKGLIERASLETADEEATLRSALVTICGENAQLRALTLDDDEVEKLAEKLVRHTAVRAAQPESVGARTLVDQFLLCEWECVLRRASSAVLVH